MTGSLLSYDLLLLDGVGEGDGDPGGDVLVHQCEERSVLVLDGVGEGDGDP